MKNYKKLYILCILIVTLLGCTNQPESVTTHKIKHPHVNWVNYSSDVFKNNISKNYILVYITSPDCPPCQLMQKTTFQSERVAPLLNRLFLPIKVDISQSAHSAIAETILKKESKIPQMLFYVRNDGTQMQHADRPNKTEHVIEFQFDELGINSHEFVYVAQVTGMVNKFQMAEIISQIRILREATEALPETTVSPTLIDLGLSEDSSKYIFKYRN